MQTQHYHVSLIHADHHQREALAEAAHRDLVRQALAGRPSQFAKTLSSVCLVVGSAMVSAGEWLMRQREAEAQRAEAAGCPPVGPLTVR